MNKRFGYIAICIIILVLVGCGTVDAKNDTLSTSEERSADIYNLDEEVHEDIIGTEVAKADFAGVVNPVSESSYDEISELDGIKMPILKGAHDEEYVRIITDAGVIDGCSFTYGNDFYVYRMKKTAGPEDVSGTYYNWTYISEYNMPNKSNVDNLMSTEEAPTIYGNNDGQGLIIWYKDKISYSIFMPTKANDEKLFNMYKTLE